MAIINRTVLIIHRSRFRALVFIFISVVIVIITFWLVLPSQFLTNESSDFRSFYSPVANNLLDGKGLITEENKPALRYPPGFPIILAVVKGISRKISVAEDLGVQVLVLLSMGLSAVLIYLLAWEIWPERWTLSAPLAWCTYPLMLWLTKQPNSEIPFLVFLYAAIFTFWLGLTRKRHLSLLFFTCGMLLGFGMLIRPFAVGMPLLFMLFLWLAHREVGWKKRLHWMAAIWLGVLLFVLPWELWLEWQTDRFYFLSSGAFPSVRDGLTFAVSEKGHRESIVLPDDVEMLMKDLLNLSQVGQIRSLSEVVAYLVGEMEVRPLVVFKLVAIKGARSWYATDSGRYELPGSLLQIIYLVPLIWGTAVAWKKEGNVRLLTVLICLLVAYAWLMTTAVLSIYRYMLPVVSLLFIFMPGFFIGLYEYLQTNRKQTIIQ